jgi:hypothetical protein
MIYLVNLKSSKWFINTTYFESTNLTPSKVHGINDKELVLQHGAYVDYQPLFM